MTGLTLGLKLTHDGAVALVNDGELIFSIEMEKLHNRARHAILPDLREVENVLATEGLRLSDIDRIALDGWPHGISRNHPGQRFAPYHEGDYQLLDGPGQPWGSVMRTAGIAPMFPEAIPAESTTHVAGHIVGTYAMSPWAESLAPAYVIVWDGGTGARVYYVDPEADNPVRFHAHLHSIYGTIYGIMGYYAGPFKDLATVLDPANKPGDLLGRRDWPGKLMSWIALGTPYRPLVRALRSHYHHTLLPQLQARLPGHMANGYHQDGLLEHALMAFALTRAQELELPEAHLLASVHQFLEDLLVEQACAFIPKGSLLCFTGGSALNIKWNSALRESHHFDDVFVPPCPNDSGSALGAAMALLAKREQQWSLRWSVFSGPRLLPRPSSVLPRGWSWRSCSPQQFAHHLMAFPDQPGMVLTGRAEIGPRALGHRSLLMMPGNSRGQSVLNEIKGREPWRPVAPVVLEEAAPFYFAPGTPDPYMLFDHHMLPNVADVIPAVRHLDGTARLQTVSSRMARAPHVLRTILEEIRDTGLPPVLCNTSANFNGCGFFPDVISAIAWGKVPSIWSEGILYERS